MDNILILAETMEELTVHTLKVLQLLWENDLYLKPQKCEFGVTKVNFLGFIIEHSKMMMDPMKLAVLYTPPYSPDRSAQTNADYTNSAQNWLDSAQIHAELVRLCMDPCELHRLHTDLHGSMWNWSDLWTPHRLHRCQSRLHAESIWIESDWPTLFSHILKEINYIIYLLITLYNYM